MDKLSMAIIAIEAHVACSNERLRQAWEIIHAKLVEENCSSHNKPNTPCCDQCGSNLDQIYWCYECNAQSIPK
jgi:hypothetical protein